MLSTNHEPVPYFNWASEQPDDYPEDCLAIFGFDGSNGMHDVECDWWQDAAICEWHH